MIINSCELNSIEELQALRDMIDNEIIKLNARKRDELFNSLREILSTIYNEGYGVYYNITQEDAERGDIDIAHYAPLLFIM